MGPTIPARAEDPFDTAAIRSRVLAGWAAAPARFREDANSEEDLALGGYRDRLVVELAQNAADAAVRAGVSGVLRLSFDGAVLLAANVGAPLDADGVQALATLRASAKRDGGTVGRFGVGFAAVLAVTDAPRIASRGGAVQFSAELSRSAVAALPSLAAERERRGGSVPVLRLPWPVDVSPPDGFDTEVRMPVRAEAVAAVRSALAGVGAELLLGLPGLARIEVDGRVLTRQDTEGGALLSDDGRQTSWRIARGGGALPAELLVGRPTEERERDRWSVLWAVPVDGSGAPLPVPGEPVLYAPTPSAEPVSVPARLIASLPLDPDRRHVVTGPLTSYLIRRAAEVYAQLVAALPDAPGMVPRPSLAGGALDGELVRACVAALKDSDILSTVDGMRVAPRDAVVLDHAEPAPFADVLDGVLSADWSGSRAASALTTLGVRRLSTPDIVDLLSTVDRPAAWWHRVYAALAAAPDRDALAALPVPLADGRLVLGARGTLLPDESLPADSLAALGVRIVDHAAAHPLLERLGARPASARGVLADDRVRAAVAASHDEEEPEPIAAATLALVAAAGVAPGELPWLADLELPTDAGDWGPAGELLLPGGPLEAVVASDSPLDRLDPDWLARWDAATFEAVGVLRTFAVLRVDDVDPGAEDYELDGEQAYYQAVLDRLPEDDAVPTLAGLVAVRDLELVDADAWPAALRMLADEPDLHAAVTEPAFGVLPGTRAPVPSYTRWWLATHPVLAGGRPDRLRAPAAADLAGLYDPCEEELASFAGVRQDLADVLADPAGATELLGRLADPARTAPPELLRDIYPRIARVLAGFEVAAPSAVRVGPDRVVPSANAAVLDAPHLLPLLDAAAVPAGGDPEAVADLLGLALASELVGARGVSSTPTGETAWSEVPGVGLAAARCFVGAPDARVAWHDGLLVSGTPVAWWPADGVDHVDVGAGPDGLGRALAQRLGRWDRRAAAAEAFARIGEAELLTAEDAAE